jgi:subfamily B ATP-binding cassette protein MsbA
MVNRGLEGVFVKLMREPIKVLVFLSVALSVDWQLTLIGICVLPLVLYTLITIGKKMRTSVRRSLQKIAGMATVVNETIKGIAIIKGFGMEDYEVGRVRGEIQRLRKFLLRMVTLHAATGPSTEFILVLGIVSFVLFSGRRVESGLLDAGDLVQLYFALAMMLDPVRKMSDVNNLIQTSVASAQRCFEFIDMKPDIEEAPDAVKLQPLASTLRFENVCFSYDGEREVLRDINLEIKKGEMIALVGPSGAGKSTFVKLLPRFYDPTSGSVSIDGVDIRRATFASLREQISIVTQDTILFAERIRDNIAFGRQTFTEERLQAAARAAHADLFIKDLPKGYDTVIGESGCTLSGGQRQRLAIARAIIKDPALLILDEATSSLDSESEQLIQEALDHFVQGRTTIVIAHRLSTIQRADRILVLDDGRIIEQGTLEELLAKDGAYRRLHNIQFNTNGYGT